MAITHGTAARNAAASGVLNLIDQGSAQTVGACLFRVGAGGAISATLPFSQNPAFGAPTNGSASAQSLPMEDSNAAGNASPVTSFDLVDRDNYAGTTEVVRGDVGTAGSDINLNDTQINSGDVVRLTALTYTAAP